METKKQEHEVQEHEAQRTEIKSFPKTSHSKWELIRKAKNDPRSLNKLIEIYYEPIYCFIRLNKRHLKREEAQNLTQEFFLYLAEKPELFEGRGKDGKEKDGKEKDGKEKNRKKTKFRSFLIAILQNIYLKEREKKKRKKNEFNDLMRPLEKDMNLSLTAKSPEEGYCIEYTKNIIKKVMEKIEKYANQKEKRQIYLNILKLKEKGEKHLEIAKKLGLLDEARLAKLAEKELKEGKTAKLTEEELKEVEQQTEQAVSDKFSSIKKRCQRILKEVLIEELDSIDKSIIDEEIQFLRKHLHSKYIVLFGNE